MTESMPEEWRPAPGHPDYDVSSLGRVRSRKRGRVRIMRPFTDKLGYVRLQMDGEKVSVHRAVAEAWHGPCPEGLEVDHINDISTDNRPENLQYITRAENVAKRAARLGNLCKRNHLLDGDNVYLWYDKRNDRYLRICRKCQAWRRENKTPSGIACTIEDCDRMADCRLRSDRPVCDMHYQRERKAEKKRRAA